MCLRSVVAIHTWSIIHCKLSNILITHHACGCGHYGSYTSTMDNAFTVHRVR